MKGLAPSAAATYAGVSRSCLARWVRTGRLHPYRDTMGRTRYLVADLERLTLQPLRRGRKPRREK
jgi:predicted site-specific integrase-resolvase